MIEMLNWPTSDLVYNWERFVNLPRFSRVVNRAYASKLLFLLILLAPVSCYLMTDCVKAPPAGEIIWSHVDNPSDDEDEAAGVAVDSTGVYIVGYYRSTLRTSDFIWRIEKRNLTDGSVIWTQTSNPSAEFDGAYAVAVDSSGLYVIGSDSSPGNSEWRIEKRSLSTGALIPTFGTDGVVANNPSALDDGPSRVAVDASGIYVVGFDESPGNWEGRVEKRNLTDGSLIWTQTINPSDGYDSATDVAVDSSGVYIVGYDESIGNSEWRIEKRSLSTGALIPTFGTDGAVANDLSDGSDSAFGVAVDSTGIYVVGRDYSPANPAFRTEKRSLTDGSLVWGYTSNPSTGTDLAGDVAVDSTGVYIIGWDESPGNYEWRIERRSLTDGSLTWEETSNPSSGDDYANEISVDVSGIYVVGTDRTPGNDEWRIEKREPSRPASRLALTVYPSSVMAGSWTSKYTVQRRDYYGNPVTLGSTLVYLTTTSAGAGRKFAETSGGAPVTSVTIPDGSSTRDFFYYDDMAGSCTIAVTSSDLAGDGKPLTITSRSGCIIATAAYGSEMTPEVSYMRHVRDEKIGSNQAGRYLVNDWNLFYYSWSPPIAELLAGSRELQYTFRILLLPVIAVVHSTAFIYDVTMSINTEFASVAAFLFAGVSSIAIYILTPLFICRSICRKRSKSHLNPQ